MFVCFPASGDVLKLRDGTTVEGEIRKSETGWDVLADGVITDVPGELVESITVSHEPAPATAAAGLASLRRSVDSQSDARQVIERYTQFIDRNAGTPAADEAKKDLPLWQDRVDKNLVRVGDDWLTQAQRTQRLVELLRLTDEARRAIKDGRTADATNLLQTALNADAKLPTALYLRSLLSLQSGQVIPARKDLEAVNAATPNHMPTLNNLAVINWRQNRALGAISLFDAAMRANPGDRTVLDNVAEALHAMPESVVRSSAGLRAQKRFNEQDAELQKRMAAQFDLHRWGGVWVSGADYARITNAKQAAEQKLADLQARYDQTQKKVAQLDANLTYISNRMKQLEAESYTTDGDGNPVQFPLPPEYNSLNNDWSKVSAERSETAGKLQPIADEAKSVQQSIPQPKYTGMQQFVGADGAPVVITS
jgi:tetratricopeptide (TPR) repeat protein